jgi:carbon storage regulator CsrA
MLTLTRRIGETLRIGDEVSVTVLDIRGNKARLKAPRLSGLARKVKNNGLCIVYQWQNMYTDW